MCVAFLCHTASLFWRIFRAGLKNSLLRGGVELKPFIYPLYITNKVVYFVYREAITLNLKLTLLNFGQSRRPVVLKQSFLKGGGV